MNSLTPPGLAPPPGQGSSLTAASFSMAPLGTSMSVSPAGIGVSPVKPVSPVLPFTPGSSGLVNPALPLKSGSPGLINPASPYMLPLTPGLANPAAPLLPNPVNQGPPFSQSPPIGLQRNLFPPPNPPPLLMHQPPPPSMLGPMQLVQPVMMQQTVPHVPYSGSIMTIPAHPTPYYEQVQPAVVQLPTPHYAPQPQVPMFSPHPPAVVQSVPVVQTQYVQQPAPQAQYVVAVPPPPPPPPLPPSIMSVHYPPMGPTAYTRFR